jgi:DNA polymerase-3 subunit beta
MKFRVEREALADAVAWTARTLPARPPVPVLAGVLLDVTGHRLTVAGFDYEVSAQVGVDVDAETGGKALVSGRLLAEITRALPAQPVQVETAGTRVEITCGSARFTLPTMPVEDYPTLPTMPETSGTLASDVFATAAQQVAVAAGRDDTLPVMTGVRFEIDGERLVLAATDRYRLAARELTWRPTSAEFTAQALVPARTLLETARSMGSGAEVTVALAPGEGMIGFTGAGRQTTARLLDGEFPRYQSLWPKESVAVALVEVAPFIEAVKRVSLVAERNRPVRLQFTAGEVVLEAGAGDEAQASESLDAGYDGEELSIAFNPAFLLDGLQAVDTDTARLAFTSATKPAVLTGKEGGTDYRYLLMPVRLSG